MGDTPREAIRNALADASGDVKALQILHGALMAGVAMMAGVTALLAATAMPPAQPKAVPVIEIMTIAHVCVASIVIVLSFILPGRMLAAAARDVLKEGGDPTGAALELLAPYRGAWIIRMSLLEGAALFGMAAVLNSVLTGALPVQPLFALNGLSAVFLLGWGAINFPTPDRIAGRLLAAMGVV